MSVKLVIHGGAGTLLPEFLTAELEAEYRGVLSNSLLCGHGVLQRGGDCVDAVVAAIKVMEDSPLFNAGRGSVYGADGRQTMDSSIQRGVDGAAGAVCCASLSKNPIELARRVYEQTPHVLLSGAGADEFARQCGVELAPPEYFADAKRLDQLRRLQAQDAVSLDHDAAARLSSAIEFGATADKKFGTVGAVARDIRGHLAAGTSTGGMAGKKFGRIGDSPLIGAGTFANQRVAVSCTGHGEHFIRACVAHDVAATMEYRALSVDVAAQTVVDKLPPACGGLIAVDADGNHAMPFNTTGMYRGTIGADGVPCVSIFR
jgi:beta-aspartyl-peptidase (threonine type)